MQNYLDTVIRQYGASPRLLALLESFNDALDPSALVDSFIQNLWDIDTAVGYGLDVLGRIVKVGRVLLIPPTSTPEQFSFNEQGDTDSTGVPWDIFNAGPPAAQSYTLTDDAYRLLILVKALSNISDRSIPSLNRGLMLLFPGRGNAYVIDHHDMSATFHFTFALTDVEIAILKQSGALPGPTGVSISYEDTTGPL